MCEMLLDLRKKNNEILDYDNMQNFPKAEKSLYVSLTALSNCQQGKVFDESRKKILSLHQSPYK